MGPLRLLLWRDTVGQTRLLLRRMRSGRGAATAIAFALLLVAVVLLSWISIRMTEFAIEMFSGF